jgi:hypothetical protein
MSQVEDQREDNVFMAKLAEQAERYDGLYLVIITCQPPPQPPTVCFNVFFV